MDEILFWSAEAFFSNRYDIPGASIVFCNTLVLAMYSKFCDSVFL